MSIFNLFFTVLRSAYFDCLFFLLKCKTFSAYTSLTIKGIFTRLVKKTFSVTFLIFLGHLCCKRKNLINS